MNQKHGLPEALYIAVKMEDRLANSYKLLNNLQKKP